MLRSVHWLLLLVVMVMTIASAQEAFRPLQGPYMGQDARIEPQMLLPGKITTGADEGCSFFFPGARSFLWEVKRDGRNVLLLLEDRQGRWQPPREVQFLDEPSLVWAFTLSPEGKFAYFTSDQQLAGAAGSNLWRTEIRNGNFAEAQPLSPAVNTESNESHPSLTRDGILYFCRTETARPGDSDLFRSTRSPATGLFETPVRLPAPLNSRFLDYDPFVAPDGSYLIFASDRPGGSGEGDLYISFSQGAEWTNPVNLGEVINSSADERHPSVSLDGRYFFFTSTRTTEPMLPPGMPPAGSMPGNGDRNIYWMKADFIEQLRR